MKNPVSYIEISFYACPQENNKINQKPEPPGGLKILIDIIEIIPGENCGGKC